MTPTERDLYMQHLFDIGDEVEIGESGTIGVITGLKIEEGSEDYYKVLYTDASDCPHEQWWRGSLLEPADDEPAGSNVIRFPCACERATRH